MAVQLNIAEAKAKLSELVARAEAGEEVVLARAGKPVVKLQLVNGSPASTKSHRRIGALAHLGPLTDAEAMTFFEPDPDMKAMLEKWDKEEF